MSHPVFILQLISAGSLRPPRGAPEAGLGRVCPECGWPVGRPQEWCAQAGLDHSRSNSSPPAEAGQNPQSSLEEAWRLSLECPGWSLRYPTGSHARLLGTGHGRASGRTLHTSYLIPSARPPGEAGVGGLRIQLRGQQAADLSGSASSFFL